MISNGPTRRLLLSAIIVSMTQNQSKQPLVSVIMATYNDERYVESTVMSVLVQTFSDFEYVIVNDGSTDDTLKILKKLERFDDRITIIDQKNQGVVASRNNAIKHAQGKYIAIIDGDDQWIPQKLEWQIAELETDSKLSLIGGGLEMVSEDDIPLGFTCFTPDDQAIKYGMCISNQFIHSSVVYRRDDALKIGLYPDTCPVEDYDFLSQITRIGTVRNLPFPVVRYRINSAGISSQTRETQAKLGNEISLQNWEAIEPTTISRRTIVESSLRYLHNPISSGFGVEIKHSYLFNMTRVGYRLINKGSLVAGLRLLWNVASTGRTGLGIVTHWAKHIIDVKLRKTVT